jgi:uncharacterized protein
MKKTNFFWVLLCVAVLAYIGAGLSRISFNVDILRLLPTKLHQVEGLSLFLKNFALPNELIITVEADDSQTAKSSAERLSVLLQSHSNLVKRAVSEPPWESSPSSLSEFLTFLMLNQSRETIGEVRGKLSQQQTEATLDTTMEELDSSVSPEKIALLSYDPFALSSSLSGEGVFEGTQQSEFSSADGRFRVVYVEAAKPLANYKQASEWLKSIRDLCLASNSNSSVKLAFTGEPAFVAEISTGMQRDMISSGIATLLLISLLFWLCYGKFTPLLCLLVLLQIIFLLSLATAGLFLNELTVVGAGFASVMIGLSVDYGYFIYQQSLRHEGGVAPLQWKCIQNIVWTSSTTAAAFFALNLSSLPGLSQLGNLVGIGVCIGALVMLLVFAPLSLKIRRGGGSATSSRLDPLFTSATFLRFGELTALGMILLLLGTLLFKGFPGSDFSASTFRPRVSASQSALEHLYSRLHDDRDMLSLIVTGRNSAEVLSRLQGIQSKLDQAKDHGELKSFFSPLSLWPDATRQRENLDQLAPLEGQLPRLQKAVTDRGFTENAFGLTSAIFHQIGSWKMSPLPVWPDNETSQWILRRLARHGDGSFLALGVVEPIAGHEEELVESIKGDGVYLVSWGSLGAELKRKMPGEILRVALALFAGIILILSFGLRSFRAVALFAATTTLVLACLAGAMSLLGMKLGFFNLAAVLLLLGTGTDYSILLLLALRRNGGDVSLARRDLGLVIFLCCTSAAAGFGSLAWANNMGLATLGKTCALGLLIDGVISLFLLPKAWELLFARERAAEKTSP